jgi:ParB family chromosome partitioning protein
MNIYEVKTNSGLSSDALIRTYKNEVERQRQMVRRSELTREKLLFLIQTMKTLCSNEDFVTLLRAEALDNLPKYLADRVLRRDVALCVVVPI